LGKIALSPDHSIFNVFSCRFFRLQLALCFSTVFLLMLVLLSLEEVMIQ
jgi:hypothetical protein